LPPSGLEPALVQNEIQSGLQSGLHVDDYGPASGYGQEPTSAYLAERGPPTIGGSRAQVASQLQSQLQEPQSVVDQLASQLAELQGDAALPAIKENRMQTAKSAMPPAAADSLLQQITDSFLQNTPDRAAGGNNNSGILTAGLHSHPNSSQPSSSAHSSRPSSVIPSPRDVGKNQFRSDMSGGLNSGNLNSLNSGSLNSANLNSSFQLNSKPKMMISRR
jgi:hypothetical protein